MKFKEGKGRAFCWVKDKNLQGKYEWFLEGPVTEEYVRELFPKKQIVWPAVCKDGVYEEPEE